MNLQEFRQFQATHPDIVCQLTRISQLDTDYGIEAYEILTALRKIGEDTHLQIQQVMEDLAQGSHEDREAARSIARKRNQTRFDEQMHAAGALIQRFIASLS